MLSGNCQPRVLCWQVASLVFLQELFSHQQHFASHYADGLDGCGLSLEADVRRSFYALARRMIDTLRGMDRLDVSK